MISRLRDEVISDMLTLGLNPYYNSLDVNPGKYNLVKSLKRNINEGLDEIKKIKQCIYEGYRMNVAIWHEQRNSYVNIINNNEVEPMSKLVLPFKPNSDKPKIIAYSNVVFSKKKLGFKFYTDDVSILDNFVDVDFDFHLH